MPENNSFILNPGQKAILSFAAQTTREVNIDVLITGTYQNNLADRIAKRITFRNNKVNLDNFDTGLNDTQTPKSYDIQASAKEYTTGRHP